MAKASVFIFIERKAPHDGNGGKFRQDGQPGVKAAEGRQRRTGLGGVQVADETGEIEKRKTTPAERATASLVMKLHAAK